MSEARDQAIKLFGRNIPVPECQISAEPIHESDLRRQIPAVPQVMDKCIDATKTEVEDHPTEESAKQDYPSALDDGAENNCQTPTQGNNAKVDHNPEENQGADTSLGGQEKVLKKPDKILPCPRCNSLNTKFCYFNNYNVNQPRHFCKNCQRYWTAGGTIRNVPVGAGRRKNKHSSSQYCQVVEPSDGGLASQADALNSGSQRVLSASSRSVEGIGEVLKFGTDAPLCESMKTLLDLNEQKRSVEMDYMSHRENVEEPSSSSTSLSSTAYTENELPEREIGQVVLPGFYQGSTLTHPLQCYPGPPWAYPWNPGWNEVLLGPSSNNPNPVQWDTMPVVAVPGFCSPSITFPFVPASYWGCIPGQPGWDATKWTVPVVGSTGCLSPSSSTSNNSCSGNSSPTLGKHSRDANSQAEEKTERCLWVPKTLRIDDPDEAAKSSIWATLGIKPNKNETILKGGTFKAFQPKTLSSAPTSDADQVLQANPAALSRSQTFQESM